ncbi:type I-C CRISPR-associated endonuclease Cas1c [Oceanidesulfovibrio marinus]|uniref:CRISPR-associated endonuclease Cas1 n=1 Tax=Oceanidesulfovibrio marinus TaxID=370038 RepID=A0ABX6NJ86_9BACT|nr:type I-C CRISPR-associated endonuclease Cas1c [Oceanidesulfovibrio marinus]QJT10271.1 type I-C CRISPR-associated endonuclease Cas1 [Oceanidesulfovibrio marinus]
MRKLLNTLYVTRQDSYLAKDGEALCVRAEKKTLLRLPLIGLEGVVCFGVVNASPALLHACAESDITVSFLSENGRYLASVRGPTSGNVLLRREQFRRADSSEARTALARFMVHGKLVNTRAVLRRALRDHEHELDAEALHGAILGINSALDHADAAADDETLRGVEGDAARIYFGVFDQLVLRREEFPFNGRNRRPPRDAVNCLLSFLYTLLLHDVRSALETVGLDPQVGYLHRDRPGRPSLALDMMEELRPWLADRMALTLINRRNVKPTDFKTDGAGGVTLADDARKDVLTAWQKRKQEEVQHPFLEERIPIGLVPYTQAMLLARHLRGELDGYPPFIWR